MFLYAGIARYSGFSGTFHIGRTSQIFLLPLMFSLSKVVKAVVNSAYYLCRLGFLGAFRRRLRLGLCGGFCLGLQPFHFLLCGMESSVGVIVQRHYDVGVSHDVLQCLGVHARVCHSGTECMPHGVRRHHIGQRLLVALVVLLGKALEHGVIVDGGFGQAVPVQEQEVLITVNLNAPAVPALLQHAFKRFIGGCAHRHLTESAFCFWRFDIVAVLGASQKLVVYIHKALLKIQVGGRQAAEFGNTKPGFQQDHHLVIILGIDGIVLHEIQKLVFLCRGKRHLWYGIVVDNLIDREVKGILAETVVLYGHIKDGFQGTLAVADGVVGNALFLHTQGPFFRVGQLHAVNAGRAQLIFGQKFHQLLAALLGSFPHIPALPGVLFIKLAYGHFLADGVYPVVKVFLYLLDFLAQGKTGPFPGRYFVGRY